MKRVSLLSILLITLIFAGMAFMEPALPSKEFKNLKVLPKNISEEALQRIMEIQFNEGLGVSCKYCHAKIPGSTDLDYASDAKPEKEIARSMMRMTLEINNKYFGISPSAIGDTLMSVTCKTCHHGEPYPLEKK